MYDHMLGIRLREYHLLHMEREEDIEEENLVAPDDPLFFGLWVDGMPTRNGDCVSIQPSPSTTDVSPVAYLLPQPVGPLVGDKLHLKSQGIGHEAGRLFEGG